VCLGKQKSLGGAINPGIFKMRLGSSYSIKLGHYWSCPEKVDTKNDAIQ
jgi:hypothetical protein